MCPCSIIHRYAHRLNSLLTGQHLKLGSIEDDNSIFFVFIKIEKEKSEYMLLHKQHGVEGAEDH